MKGDRHDAASPARRTRHQKISAWWGRNALWAAIGGYLLLLAVLYLIGQLANFTGEPCYPGDGCQFVR
ncbi:hypothetical protein ACFWC9_40395 [Streptomyces goshikiensis]|uniref:hypothetical protein n=1 Tax=Streptomyces goshikiensis TaxID=1942 RepID=UPI003695563F